MYAKRAFMSAWPVLDAVRSIPIFGHRGVLRGCPTAHVRRRGAPSTALLLHGDNSSRRLRTIQRAYRSQLRPVSGAILCAHHHGCVRYGRLWPCDQLLPGPFREEHRQGPRRGDSHHARGAVWNLVCLAPPDRTFRVRRCFDRQGQGREPAEPSVLSLSAVRCDCVCRRQSGLSAPRASADRPDRSWPPAWPL
jgi:hypothetical protein